MENYDYGNWYSPNNLWSELVEGMRGKYWEMWYFEISFQGIEFKENYMPKKYAVAILPLAGFLTTIGAAISFLKKV